MNDPARFHLEIGRNGNDATVTVEGDIDIATVGELRSARESVLRDTPSRLLIDLREVSFIDSSGLKFLLETHRLSQQDSWELALLRPPGGAMKVFSVTGADKHLPFVDA